MNEDSEKGIIVKLTYSRVIPKKPNKNIKTLQKKYTSPFPAK